ncbi:TadE/TadG family type IV pilus assembly protein [Aporhodopirellula aestuarii]|uniref:Pilus assembly protein n=1 Tax=Aporhodopirellula aestuarii TaxID=2950107 RepID=A0ABT0U952_9BACT|nr:TadE/TadG family type IV pilus assembly protein [Aporhodopirellula aestuarii]MCM2373497.1 pilus assembly protein [Aporhodopirellula aestuarii]
MITHRTRVPSLGFRRPSTSASRRAKRTGAVAVEFAVVAPLLFMFFFAGFEFCRVAMIRHTVDNAVYEGARRGIVPGGTNGEVRTEAERVLSTIGLRNFSLSVTPAVFDDETDEITVRLTVPLDVNTFVPAQYFVGKEIQRELTMRREGR